MLTDPPPGQASVAHCLPGSRVLVASSAALSVGIRACAEEEQLRDAHGLRSLISAAFAEEDVCGALASQLLDEQCVSPPLEIAQV